MGRESFEPGDNDSNQPEDENNDYEEAVDDLISGVITPEGDE